MLSRSLAGFAALLSLTAVAAAGERVPYAGRGYGDAYGYPGGYGAGGYGFADGAVGGAYIGAPLTRFPRPSEIVPPAWGYGTYGVPTATGIRQAPVGDPKIYVVRGVGPAPHRGRARPWTDPAAAPDAQEGGPHIVSVTVPRR